MWHKISKYFSHKWRGHCRHAQRWGMWMDSGGCWPLDLRTQEGRTSLVLLHLCFYCFQKSISTSLQYTILKIKIYIWFSGVLAFIPNPLYLFSWLHRDPMSGGSSLNTDRPPFVESVLQSNPRFSHTLIHHLPHFCCFLIFTVEQTPTDRFYTTSFKLTQTCVYIVRKHLDLSSGFTGQVNDHIQQLITSKWHVSWLLIHLLLVLTCKIIYHVIMKESDCVSQQNDVYEGWVIVSSIVVPLDVQFLHRLGKTSRLSMVF